ncbi:hypothetical protein PIROE2DRAFT_17769 [Piromyces sp. E2]|nr:hypothetical protein PIROE2DRAFT_17769 [Piromyces sp. E2]|eukprot:OUM57293.1 hypothetical protein PIROE2DRAFT_17769 [Piromyces sp. E2]
MTYTSQYYTPLTKNIRSIISNKTLKTYRRVVLFEIYCNIERKYNQQHVMHRLKEEIDIDHINDDETNSLETIVTTKKVIKKEKVYKKVSDSSYVSKFLEYDK